MRTVGEDPFEVGPARAVADAVLFEGYLLYPYRASAAKNQVRWQFGVLFPRVWAQAQPSEAWRSHTEILLEPGDQAVLRVVARCLQVQARTVEEATDQGFRPVPSLSVDGTDLLTWDEATTHEADATVPVADLLAGERTVSFELPADRAVEDVRAADGRLVGRIVRERHPVRGRMRIAADRVGVPYDVVKVRLDVENLTSVPATDVTREAALHGALIAAHALIAVDRGAFVSLLEPPEWASQAVADCRNEGVFPVLVGEQGRRDLVLSSPIILYDHPEIAAESPGELFDGLEIDEILSLRTLALTEDEKREARATDPRAAAIVDRVDVMPAEIWERLHGAVRSVRGPDQEEPSAVQPGAQPWWDPADTSMSPRGEPSAVQPGGRPWWDPGADASVSPETDSVQVGTVKVSRGTRVLLAPAGRTDAQDMFLAGREATVAAVLFDVDDNVHLAVTLADDPAAELQHAVGRYRYFSPDEVVPLQDVP